jgi:molybdopterin/thiamine biosynthesis adenylyltransferase
MKDEALLRYARHILLDPPIGLEGQTRLQQAHVLLVGCGGLGCAVALYLAASGIGTLSLVDADHVELSNLQRQIGHTTDSIGQLKVHSLAARCQALNPHVRLHAYPNRADDVFLQAHLPAVDLIVDACDNFETRQVIDEVCWTHQRPWVMGSALGLQGQMGVWDYRPPHEVPLRRYRDFFPPDYPPPSTQERCANSGVLAPLVGLIGSAQAIQALRLLLKTKRHESSATSTMACPNQFWCIDGWNLAVQAISGHGT